MVFRWYIYVKNTGKLWEKVKRIFRFSDYAGFIRDVVVITDIPQKIIEEAKIRNISSLRLFVLVVVARPWSNFKRNWMSFHSFWKQDGIFGNETLRAVKAFQVANSLVSDGIVGPKSNAILNGMNPSKNFHLLTHWFKLNHKATTMRLVTSTWPIKAFGCLQIKKALRSRCKHNFRDELHGWTDAWQSPTFTLGLCTLHGNLRNWAANWVALLRTKIRRIWNGRANRL